MVNDSHSKNMRKYKNRSLAKNIAAALFSISKQVEPISPDINPNNGDYAAQRQKLFEQVQAEIWKREVSNSENFDKAILAYSSAGLALSLGFLKDFVSPEASTGIFILFLSWLSFSCAITVTILSYIFSQLALKDQLNNAEEYYINENEEALLNGRKRNAKLTEYFNIAAGPLFIIGMALSALFVSINLYKAHSKEKVESNPMPTPVIHNNYELNVHNVEDQFRQNSKRSTQHERAKKIDSHAMKYLCKTQREHTHEPENEDTNPRQKEYTEPHR